MIIVNQNKKVIMNFNDTNYIAINDNDPTIYARTNNDSEIILGRYKTRERAKEIFEEIQVASSDFKYFEIMKRPETAQNVIKRYGTWNIYKMPEE